MRNAEASAADEVVSGPSVRGSGTMPSPHHPGATAVLLLFPLYPGGTLQEKVDAMAAKRNHYSEHELLTLFQGVCLAVHEMHSCQPEPIAHRDIKLSNVLLDAHGRPVLMDFGSADTMNVEVTSHKESLRVQEQAAEQSTMSYRAPELFNVMDGCTITGKTDVWSLGCLLFAMCHYETPFEMVAGQTGSLALAIAQGKLKWPENNPYSSEVQGLITSMLKLDPAERVTLEEVLNKLGGLV